MSDLDVCGRIFNIQRYSIHDGHGIRTIVFLKGCVLRCRWCCNPESQSYEKQTMVTNGKTETVGKDVTVGELMKELRKDRPYYRRSGGGITLSGGEVLCQPDFAGALLRACQAEGLHTAIETAAAVSKDAVDKVVPYVDEVLMDIKHMDAETHRLYTGKTNELVLHNAQYIARMQESAEKELVIRIPVVPSFNDKPEQIRAIARFAATLPGVRRLHLLPYHRLGQGKYEGLGRAYSMGDIEPPTPEAMRYLLTVAEESGLLCRIGG